jgi:hypothetical protein
LVWKASWLATAVEAAALNRDNAKSRVMAITMNRIEGTFKIESQRGGSLWDRLRYILLGGSCQGLLVDLIARLLIGEMIIYVECRQV